MTERRKGIPARTEPTRPKLTSSEFESPGADLPGPAIGSTNGAPPSASDDPPPRARRFRRPSVSILSKLLAMLLGVGIVSAGVVGYVGYRNGTDSLREAAVETMVEVRQSTTREITEYFDDLRSDVLLDSLSTDVVQAAAAFVPAFAELQAQDLDPALRSTLEQYYADSFIPQLEERTQSAADAAILVPENPGRVYLQAHYTAASDDFDEKLAITDAGDGSAWSAAHARYHDHFRRAIELVGYEDAMIVDTEGNIVYTAYKGIDLGRSLESPPLSETGLADAYTEVMASPNTDIVVLTDLQRYTPSLGTPAAFAVSPIASGDDILGALVYQIPLDEVNRIMTVGQEWEANGLGETGETYLVGDDGLMRSDSRSLIEDPEQYRADIVDNGTPSEVADRQVFVQGSVLLQPIDSRAGTDSIRGRTGSGVNTDYRGQETLGAWGPVDIPGLQWGLVAEVDTAEAFEPVNTFTRNLAIAVGALVLAISIASLLLSQVFVRPIRRLLGGVEEVAAGNLDVQVPVTSRDEFGDLGRAFNAMGRSLRTKADLLAEQEAENERMLLSLMPEDVARRYREGEETISAEHSDVTVVFADLVGFDEFTAGMSSAQAHEHINALVRGFDEAADRLGVERVRTLHNGYLASCGLVVPRVDSARRAIDFVLEMHEVVESFDAQHGTDLVLRAGVDTGTVTSGLVGRQGLAYDMWGDTVNLAHRLRATSPEPGVFVTKAVHDRLRDQYDFADAGTVDTAHGPEPVWRLGGVAS